MKQLSFFDASSRQEIAAQPAPRGGEKRAMQKQTFTAAEKQTYYAARAKDKSLTDKQRKYAEKRLAKINVKSSKKKNKADFSVAEQKAYTAGKRVGFIGGLLKGMKAKKK